MNRFKIMVACGLFSLTVMAQTDGDFNYKQVNTVRVLDTNGHELAFPFAGGLNSCQFGSIDLNRDGVKDLVVFDRHGNRLLTFINNNVPGSISYSYAPQYVAKFPPLRELMELVDYNDDGKEDIFTYTTGGIKVYRNDSDTALRFTQVTHPYLTSLQGITLTNILVTSADYPAIADIDGDGDQDILTFWGLGSFVEWHKNMSMELYGTADSLVFVKSSNCWGRFAEGAESNAIILDTCVSFDQSRQLKDSDPKHTGSTLLAYDFNDSGRKDLVIGDVDFPGVIALTNGGTADTAVMISQTTDFPTTVHPVNIPSFPAVTLIDVNNDGHPDMLVSPFDPSLVRSQNNHSCWLYLNSGKKSAAYPGFSFQQDDFLQDEMLDFGSGAYPVFFDYNGDGLQDLIVGNFGYLDTSYYTPATGLVCEYVSSLALLKNIGTHQQPAFQLIDRDYLGLSDLKMQSLVPAIGDVNGDGVPDLLCGNSKGKFVYLQNYASVGQPADFILNDPAYRQLGVGNFSAPQIIDLDVDGLNDIISGKRDGTLTYFKNIGPASNPQYTRVTDSLGGIDVTNTSLSYFGYSVPAFLKGNDGKISLYVGSEFGDVFVYKDIEGNLSGKFTLAGTLNGVKEGWRSAVAAGNLDGDSLTDLFVGNYSGGIGYFEGIKVSANSIHGPDQEADYKLLIRPNPATESISLEIPGAENVGSCEIEIYDLPGKRVLYIEMVTGFPITIPIRSLSSGIYNVKIRLKIGKAGQMIELVSKMVVVK